MDRNGVVGAGQESEEKFLVAPVPFFAKADNLAVFKNVLRALEVVEDKEGKYVQVVRHSFAFTRALVANPDFFDKHSEQNIEWIGSRFVEVAAELAGAQPEKYRDKLIIYFYMAFRFLCEVEFKATGMLAPELSLIKPFVLENLDQFDAITTSQLLYASYAMPASIIREVMQDSRLTDFRSYKAIAADIKRQKDEWTAEFGEREKIIKAQKDSLDNISKGLYFVDLVHGFRDLQSEKEQESKRARLSLGLLGGAMVVVGLFHLIYFAWNFGSPHVIEDHAKIFAFTVPSTIALEIILFYFFRVVLTEYKGIGTQLLQIKLRVSLCRFIQGYVDYAKKMKEKDSSSLDKFETLIFSGIVQDSGAVPSTFDGIEQIVKVLKAARSD